MCTIILAHDVVDGVPVMFGANRDEHFERPAEAPRLHNDRPLRVVAPRDLKAGGTWLGVNEAGVLAAITNRFGAVFADERRSRGELVFEALAHDTAVAAADAIAALDATDYNGFHLAVATPDEMRLVWGDGERMSQSVLPKGAVSVLTERSLGASRNERKRRVKRKVEELVAHGELSSDALEELLSECDDGSIDATCVSMRDIKYGTRSSTIMGLGGEPFLRFTDGPPCETGYSDHSGLLTELF
jgi:uncharacterized protein with NRDE domain